MNSRPTNPQTFILPFISAPLSPIPPPPSTHSFKLTTSDEQAIIGTTGHWGKWWEERGVSDTKWWLDQMSICPPRSHFGTTEQVINHYSSSEFQVGPCYYIFEQLPSTLLYKYYHKSLMNCISNKYKLFRPHMSLTFIVNNPNFIQCV